MKSDILAAVEAILFAAGEPLEPERIAEGLELSADEAAQALKEVGKRLDDIGSGICLLDLAGRYQLATRQQFRTVIGSVLDVKKNQPLSQAALEVLAVIAYNQPVTRAFVEQVRGVDCSGVVNTLCAKGLIEECGRLELPGRPIAYRTTPVFLRCFCMSSLSELPAVTPSGADAPPADDTPAAQ